MYIRVAALLIASFLPPKAAANEPARSGLPGECSLPSVLALSNGIKSVLSQSEKTVENPYKLWSKDANFRKWEASPRSTLTEVERYLRCAPTAASSEVQLATLTLQCLSFDAYLDYLKRLSRAAKSDAFEWALHYAVAPGTLGWSTHLASNYTAAKVKSTLKMVANSPNATPALQRMIMEILDGRAKKALAKNPVEPLLTCGSGVKN